MIPPFLISSFSFLIDAFILAKTTGAIHQSALEICQPAVASPSQRGKSASLFLSSLCPHRSRLTSDISVKSSPASHIRSCLSQETLLLHKKSRPYSGRNERPRDPSPFSFLNIKQRSPLQSDHSIKPWHSFGHLIPKLFDRDIKLKEVRPHSQKWASLHDNQ